MHSELKSPYSFSQTDSALSLTIVSVIVLAWSSSLVLLLSTDVTTIPPLLVVSAIWLRCFLHTGLFIATHESIHGLISSDRRLNALVGHLTSFLYALLPYKHLAKNHQLHHQYPASPQDPDFCLSNSDNLLFWYCTFMKQYQEGKQIWISLIGMTIVFWGLVYLQIPVANLFLFWVFPILLSSWQLFVFGVFLPHRKTNEDYSDRHRAKSNNYPTLISFLACYHFGYHWEHHQYPHLPWYQLPAVRKHQALSGYAASK